jgi:histone H3/H4
MGEDLLIVVSKVKEYIKSKGCQTSAEAIPALSKEVEKLLDKAIERVKANGRQTVKPQDL